MTRRWVRYLLLLSTRLDTRSFYNRGFRWGPVRAETRALLDFSGHRITKCNVNQIVFSCYTILWNILLDFIFYERSIWQKNLHTHTHTHTYIHKNIYTCIYIYIYIYIYINTYVHTHTYTHTHTYIYIYVHTYTYIQIYIYIYTYIHTHTRTHIYIYIHTHTHTHKRFIL